MDLSPTTIILGIIFFLIIAIIIVIVFFYNRTLPPNALVTTFGITIREPKEGLYMTMLNIDAPIGSTGFQLSNVVPIISLKAVPLGGTPEPTEGWLLDKPNLSPSSNVITLSNPTNASYMRYGVTPDGTRITTPYIQMDAISKPSDPVDGTSAVPANLGWFVMEQTVVNSQTLTAFRSLYPGPINNQNQYLIPGTVGSITTTPNVIPVTIGIPTNGNNLWLVGTG